MPHKRDWTRSHQPSCKLSLIKKKKKRKVWSLPIFKSGLKIPTTGSSVIRVITVVEIDGSHKHQLVLSRLGHRVLDISLRCPLPFTSERETTSWLCHYFSPRSPPASTPAAHHHCLSGVPAACDGPTFLFLASTQRTVSMFPPPLCSPGGKAAAARRGNRRLLPRVAGHCHRENFENLFSFLKLYEQC